jgi:hypothetical protein
MGEATTTVQVTPAPNQTTETQIDNLFNTVDTKHLRPYCSDSIFQTGITDDTRSCEF